MDALISQIQKEAETGEFDEFTSIMERLDARPNELFWKESSDGVLFVGDDLRSPSICARIALTETGEFEAAEVSPDEINFNQLDIVSRPESAVQERQFD